MRDGEPNIYTALATLRNGYVQGQWSRLQLFLIFNAAAMPIALATGQTPPVKILISGVGILIHYAVLLGAIRANDWTGYLDEKLAALESLDTDPSADSVRVRVFSDPNFGNKRRSKWATRFSFVPLAIIVIGFWFITFIYNLYLLVRA